MDDIFAAAMTEVHQEEAAHASIYTNEPPTQSLWAEPAIPPSPTPTSSLWAEAAIPPSPTPPNSPSLTNADHHMPEQTQELRPHPHHPHTILGHHHYNHTSSFFHTPKTLIHMYDNNDSTHPELSPIHSVLNTNLVSPTIPNPMNVNDTMFPLALNTSNHPNMQNYLNFSYSPQHTRYTNHTNTLTPHKIF